MKRAAMILAGGMVLTTAAGCGPGSHATVTACTHALIAQYPHESHIPAPCDGLTQAQQKQAAEKAAAYELNKAFGG